MSQIDMDELKRLLAEYRHRVIDVQCALADDRIQSRDFFLIDDKEDAALEAIIKLVEKHNV